MLGKERTHLKNSLFGFFLSDDSKPVFKQFLAKVFRDRIKEDCDLTLQPEGKQPMYVHLIGIVKENVDNCFVNIVDITRRKLAEEEVIRMKEDLEKRVFDRTAQLEATVKELEAFSYSVSHDFRAPVRHINGFAGILNDEYRKQLPEKAKHYLDIITTAAKKMDSFIDDLLSFSRAGRSDMNKSWIDMKQLVEHAILRIKPSIGEREITWNIAGLPEVFGDYDLILQVWINLLGNAVKFTRTKEKAIIRVDFKKEGNELVFCIKDNGVGFNMNYAQKLFGVFQRLHSHDQFEGTGVGLANVRRIITRHGGRTWAESEVDKGATFCFSLPAQE